MLCDLHLPELDGIELVQELQRIAGKQRAFEAIMLTGHADKQHVIKALRAGAAFDQRAGHSKAVLTERLRA